MAEDKNSFIAYCNWGDTFDELTDEQAGKLVKHLFDYVRDKEPKPDQLTKLLFIPIQQTLKRDLKKYEKYVGKQKVNGAKGGRPKKPKKPKPFLENPTKPKKADSVNVSVNVNDNVNDNVKEEKKEGVIFPFDSEEFFKWWDLWKDYKLKEHKFQYKTVTSEQAALKKLTELSGGEEKNALEIIEESIANGWKGFFKLSNNEETRRNNKDRGASINQIKALAEKHFKKG